MKLVLFYQFKDLEKVNGIGPKTLAKIEPFITIEQELKNMDKKIQYATRYNYKYKINL